jgi:hypothetical protein
MRKGRITTMAKRNKDILQELRDQITELEVVYRWHQRREAEHSARSNGHGRAISAAQVAHAMLDANTAQRKKKPGPQPGSGGRPKKRQRGKDGELPDVTVPAGMPPLDDITDPREAIVLTLKALKKPTDTPTLTATMLAAGWKRPATLRQPVMRFIGVQASMMVRMKKDIRKKADHWSLR